MESIVGNWKYTNGTKENEVATAMGVPASVQESMKKNRPILTYALAGNSLTCTSSLDATKPMTFELGKTVEQPQPDGNIIRMRWSFANGKWTEEQEYPNGATLRQEKAITGDKMTVKVLFEKNGEKIEGVANYVKQ